MSTKITSANWAKLLNYSAPLGEAVRRMIPIKMKPFIQEPDVVTETLKYAFENPQQWQNIPPEELIFYLRRMARFHINNKTRTVVTHREVLLGDFQGVQESFLKKSAPSVSPARKMHQGEKARAVTKILDRLKKESHRKILQLVWIEELPMEEVARRMNRTPKASYVILHRALKACRRIARRHSFAGFRISGETV